MDWETPDVLFDELNAEFEFTVDVCADITNHKCKRYFSIDGSGIAHDGLQQSWSGETCWMNPPYAKGEIEKWVKKAYYESTYQYDIDDGNFDSSRPTVVALLPNRSDTKWYHSYVHNRAEIRPIRGRLKFLLDGKPILNKAGQPCSAPFPSIIAIYRPVVYPKQLGRIVQGKVKSLHDAQKEWRSR